MTLLSASFEVSPSGSAIPLTGGADGFAYGSNGSGTSFVSDSGTAAAVASGSFAGKITIGATAAQSYRGWSWSGGVVHTRQYVYLTASPNARFTLWSNETSSTMVSRVRVNTDRTVGVGTSSTVWLTTAPIPLNTLCRIEASFNHAAGTMSLDVYSGNSTTPIAGGSVSVTGVGFVSSSITRVYGGVLSTLTNFTLRTDAWAVSDVARQGPVVTGGTVTGVTAQVTVQAAGGSVTAVVGGTVTISGVTAQMVAQGGVRPAPPAAPTDDPTWPPDPYREAIRSGSYALTYIVNASYGGVPVAGAQDLRPTGGSITDTTKPGVRRVLNLQLAPEPGLFDRLAPVGTTLAVTAQVRYTDRSTVDIPMGVFDVDTASLSEGGGELSLTAPDKWVRVQRAKFVGPAPSIPGATVVDEIARFIRDALGAGEVINVTATSLTQVGVLTWEKDRDKTITDLAASIGAWVYFDRNGVCTIADLPTVGASADWLIDASASGVLIELDRTRSRANTYNVVVVSSSSADGELFPPVMVYDSDPASPTYAGTDPATGTGAGPFGVVPYFYDSPILWDANAARMAGGAILAKTVGLASSISAGSAPNPALDAGDVIDVMPPRERYDIARVLERHMVDTVSHPLAVGSTQHIDGRSTRTDEYA